ncbi:MAG: element excision factor XisH family protein [Spirosomataceae bacterium]
MAKDLYHYAVREALMNDGWVITNDPYIIETDDVNYEVDLGAEKMIAAEKENEKIAVEIKSFTASSFVYEFHRVLGQMLNYSIGLEDFEPDRKLYLAVPLNIYEDSFHLSFVQKAIKRFKIKLIVYDSKLKKVIRWKKK